MSDLFLVDQTYKVASAGKEVVETAEEWHVFDNVDRRGKEVHVEGSIVQLIPLAVRRRSYVTSDLNLGCPVWSSMLSLSWDL